MNRIACVSLFFISLFCATPSPAQTSPVLYSYSGKAQGTHFKIIYFSNSADSITTVSFDSIFVRLDSSLSVYKKNSLIHRFNLLPDTTICDEHLAFVVSKAKYISTITKGTFDITIGAITLPRKFSEYAPVDTTAFQRADCFGENLLHVNNDCVTKFSGCVKVDVDGIAQGYTVDVLADFLSNRGFSNFLIDVGGELKWSGINNSTGKPWNIAIEIPGLEPWSINQDKLFLQSSKGALTTSGNYRKSLIDKSSAVSLFNAHTQTAVKENRLSVSVYSQEGLLSDALDNAFMAMSFSNIKKFLRRNPSIACLLVYKVGSKQKVFISKNFPVISKK